MDGNESIRQETQDVGKSAGTGDSEALGAVAKSSTAGPRVGSRRGPSFSWFRLVVAFAAVGMLLMAVEPRIPGLKRLLGERPLTWEYRVINVSPDVANDRGTTTVGALAANQITVSDARLNALGLQGWELAGSYLEMETAFPNFGDSEYVTGLRDNVRPQRLVLILKRPVQEWSDQSPK